MTIEEAAKHIRWALWHGGIYVPGPTANKANEALEYLTEQASKGPYDPVALYRDFSEERYAAGWMGSPEEDVGLQGEFREWVTGRIKGGYEYRLAVYERDALPVLERIIHEILRKPMGKP